MRYLMPLLLALTLQSASYRADIEKFQQQRFDEIAGATGWSALVGLHFVDPGSEYVVGSDAISGVRIESPSVPGRLGTMLVRNDGATMRVSTGVDATVKGVAVTEVDMRPGTSAADGLKIGDLTLVLIRRGQKFALRVWDAKAPSRLALVKAKTLKWLPIDPKWRVTARFVAHPDTQPRMKILNVLGETVEMRNPGTAFFTVGGKEYQLEAALESDNAKELFFIFKDGTSNKTTYGAGRYLYTPLAADGKVDLDFNKAKNPPCAFTDYATCPLPPAKNRLTLAVNAGELDHKHK
jgi:uncharacterized protein (DUF1684 family)